MFGSAVPTDTSDDEAQAIVEMLVERHRAELWNVLAADRVHPPHTDFPLEQTAEAIDPSRPAPTSDASCYTPIMPH